jgi:hypothetical protein
MPPAVKNASEAAASAMNPGVTSRGLASTVTNAGRDAR